MRAGAAVKIALLLAILVAVFSDAVAVAASQVGRWSGSFGGAGRSGGASVTFRSDGSCTLNALGFSASGNYGGGSIHVSAYGYSMSLSYSVSGDHMTISGSKGKYSGRMSLRRKGSAGDSAKTAANALYGRWLAESNGVKYEIGLYRDGFLCWAETPQAGDGAQGEAGAGAGEPRVYGARLTVAASELTLKPLEDALPDAPALWPEAARESGKAWAFSYKLSGESLALSDGERSILTLSRAGDADSAPSEALFRPYIKLERGDRGEAVRQLQEALIASGWLDGAADGIFGKKTLAAVKALQAASGIAQDGIAGRDVFTALGILGETEAEG